MRFHTPLLCFLFAALTVACVSHVPIDAAPCPCPQGYECCPTLSACVARDTPEACPPQLPSSSEKACQRDQDCQANETCHAWKNANGKLAGPQECRKSCSSVAPCAEAEKCQLMPHDGSSLYEADLVRGCVPSATTPGRETCECSECDDAQVGRTYCDGNVVKGCFLAFNEVCGVACQPLVVHDCGQTVCELQAGGASCPSTSDDGDDCIKFPCSACPLEPGAYACDGDAVSSCARADFPGTGCTELCFAVSSACPEGSSCRANAATHCGP